METTRETRSPRKGCPGARGRGREKEPSSQDGVKRTGHMQGEVEAVLILCLCDDTRARNGEVKKHGRYSL